MKIVFSESYEPYRQEVTRFIENFNLTGEVFVEGRNSIRLFDLNGKKLNIKSFKIPNLVNKVAYRFFRESKAARSFKYAQELLARGIGTPAPVSYAEETSAIAFGSSYYVCEHLEYDLTYRELVQQPDFPNHEEILRAFTRFTFKMHQQHIEFLDHSPGNTLIQLNGGNYLFFLVDLNRMNFRELDLESRLRNFSRLTPKIEMVEVMADEYAQLSGAPKDEVFEKIWAYTEEFQKKFFRKKRLQKKLKFWK